MTHPKPSLVEISKHPQTQKNLPGQIYTELKRRILSGLIVPGEPLREQALCDELEVSRTPLREALNRLGNEDLVVFRPNHGYLAAPLTSDGFRQLKDLRIVVESKVAFLAALRARKHEIRAMREAAGMPEILPGDDASFIEFCRANARFHLLVVRSTRNFLFENVVMSALDQYQRPAYLGIGRVTDHSKASKCHEDLVDALEAHDPIKAEVVMCNHIIGGSDRIIRALEEAGL